MDSKQVIGWFPWAYESLYLQGHPTFPATLTKKNEYKKNDCIGPVSPCPRPLFLPHKRDGKGSMTTYKIGSYYIQTEMDIWWKPLGVRGNRVKAALY